MPSDIKVVHIVSGLKMAERVFFLMIQSSIINKKNQKLASALPSATTCVISIWEMFNGSQLIDFIQVQLQKYDLLSCEQCYNYFHNKQHNYEPFAMLIYFHCVLYYCSFWYLVGLSLPWKSLQI